MWFLSNCWEEYRLYSSGNYSTSPLCPNATGLGSVQPVCWFAKKGLVIVLLSKIPVGKRLITQVDQNSSSQNLQEVGEMWIIIQQQKQQNQGEGGKQSWAVRKRRPLLCDVEWLFLVSPKLIKYKTSATTYCLKSSMQVFKDSLQH